MSFVYISENHSILDKDIYLIADECTVVLGRSVAAALVGILDGDASEKPQLFEVMELESTNNVTISQLIITCMTNLFDGNIQYNRLKFFITDAASYMISAGRNLKSLYPLMRYSKSCRRNPQNFS